MAAIKCQEIKGCRAVPRTHELSAPWKGKQTETQGASARAVCLDLTLCGCRVWMSLCGEPHQSSTEGLSCCDLWPRRAPETLGGRVEAEHRTGLRHKGQGWASEFTRAKKKQARIKMVICLVNFYGDLWAATQENHRGTYIAWRSHFVGCFPSTEARAVLNPVKSVKCVLCAAVWSWFGQEQM